ncbi:MAG TPA: hypothetical protein VF177_13445 [Anaerolineae bacterium]
MVIVVNTDTKEHGYLFFFLSVIRPIAFSSASFDFTSSSSRDKFHKLASCSPGRSGDSTSTGEQTLATVGHYAIGGLLGAGYGVVHAATGAAAIPAGPLYGLGTYALNFMGLGPATGLMPGPWKQEPPDVGREIMMHAVYGTVTALVADRLLQKMDGQQLPSRQDMPTARQVEEEFFEEEYDQEEMLERMS